MSFSIRAPDVKKKVDVACFDISHMGCVRNDYFRPKNHPKFDYDLPGWTRCYKLTNRHRPADEEKDPYLVGLVIALAQKQRREAAESPDSANSTVNLLLSLSSLACQPVLAKRRKEHKS
jgi:hypothetical protein